MKSTVSYHKDNLANYGFFADNKILYDKLSYYVEQLMDNNFDGFLGDMSRLQYILCHMVCLHRNPLISAILDDLDKVSENPLILFNSPRLHIKLIDMLAELMKCKDNRDCDYYV